MGRRDFLSAIPVLAAGFTASLSFSRNTGAIDAPDDNVQIPPARRARAALTRKNRLDPRTNAEVRSVTMRDGPVPVSTGCPRASSRAVPGCLVTHAWFPPLIVLEPQGGFDPILLGRVERTVACRVGTVLTQPAGPRHANHIGPSGARGMVHARFRENMRIDEIAAEAGAHPAHPAVVFRRVHRQPLGSYMRRLRVDWAADRLLDTEAPVAAIACEAGFADQAHLTRCFRQVTGTTPAAYRRARRTSRR